MKSDQRSAEPAAAWRDRAEQTEALRLFCFAHAGGTAATFRAWGGALGSGVEVVPVELPGRARRLHEPLHRHMGELVQALLPELEPLLLGREYALFGHSLGAKVAFALTREIERRGLPGPRLLLVSGCPAPQLVDPRPELHGLPLPRLIAELRRMNGTPAAVLESEELMALMLPTLQADYALSETFRVEAGASVAAPIIALGGSDDPEATRAELAAWHELTRAGFRLEMFAGDHFFIHAAFPELMSTLRALLGVRHSAPLDGRDVAVIGMSGRFPGARGPDELWELLRSGRSSIVRLEASELRRLGVPRELWEHPRYVPAFGRLEDADRFDAEFFGYSPAEAALLDPQQRLLLECAWAAMEDAGYAPAGLEGRNVGVFAGASANGYGALHAARRADRLDPASTLQVLLGNSRDYLAARVSHHLKLRGPSVTVQGASATSLVALHQAVQALLCGDCELALVGAASVTVPSLLGHVHQPGGKDSPDGRCRAFSTDAAGTVWGNGVGVVVLKLARRAFEDRDHVRALIRGSALDNDGGRGRGFSAPHPEGQTAAVLEALRRAGVDAGDVGYVEAHGTGTMLGDPVEIRGLSAAFEQFTRRRNYCFLGSVKPNLGHLDAAAGMAGLFKAILVLERGQIPPLVDHGAPHPALERSPFRTNSALEAWPEGSGPRVACLGSLGMGGINAHVVLEQAPETLPATPAGEDWQILPVSARSPQALGRACTRLAEHLDRRGAPLADVAYTLQVGRHHFRYRAAIVARTHADAIHELSVARAAHEPALDAPHVALLLPGQGAQFAGMAEELYREQPEFRAALDECAERLRDLIGRDLRRTLFGSGPLEERDRELTETWLTQPALFSVEFALAKLWGAWGLAPRALLGHSIGELVAACLAGVFTLPDALAVVALRGRLMQDSPEGRLLAVAASEAELRAELEPSLSLAAVNGHRLCTVAGSAEEIARFEQACAARARLTRRLPGTRAFHSAFMDPVRSRFRDALRSVTLRAPELPFVSNVTGTWITAAQACDPEYWAAQLRETVRFADGLETLLQLPSPVLLEVGPGQTLTKLGRRSTGARSARLVASLPATRAPEGERRQLYSAAAALWEAGVGLDLSALGAARGPRSRVPLPTYPFQSRRYWIKGPEADPPATAGELELEAGTEPPESRACAQLETPLELRVAELWKELLGIDTLTRDSDFLALGGHSLLGAQLIAALEARFGVTVSLAEFFAQPTIAALAGCIAAKASTAAPPAEPARPAASAIPDGATFPLTDVQQAYYVGRQPGAELGGVACWIYAEFERDDVDLGRLARAVQRLIARHEMLRAVIVDERAQRVLDGLPDYHVECVDLSGLSEVQARRKLEQLRASKSRRVGPAQQWPLFEVSVVRLPANVRLLVGVDTLIADARSLDILARELQQSYEDPERELAPVPVTFRECVALGRCSEDREQRARAYWLDRLADFPLVPELPLAQRPAELGGPRFRRLTGRVDGARWARLVARASSAGLTPSGLLLAAFSEALLRWSKSSRFCLTLTLFNRPPVHPAVNDVVGDFTSVALLPIEGQPASSFSAAARRVQNELWAALDHREFSAVRVLRELARQRKAGLGTTAPIVFTSLLDLEGPAPEFWAERSVLGVRRFGITHTPQVWIDHQVYRESGGIAFNWDFVDGLFPADLVEHLFWAYSDLLERLADDDAAWSAPSPVRLPPEQAQCIRSVNATACSLPGGLLHAGFFERAERRPGAPAVISEARTLSYGELAACARRIGHGLSKAGTERGELVAVAMQPGWEQPAAMLGILAAGAAYLPIDPAQPVERIRQLLASAQVRTVLTQGVVQGRLAAAHAGRICALGDGADQRWLGEDAPAAARQAETDLAYVMYTSGSSGSPKGVMIDHRGAVNTIQDLNRRYQVDEHDRVLAVSALNFDLSVYDHFGLLAAGGAVVVPNADRHRDPSHWAELVTGRRVTLWNSVPALLDVLLDYAAGHAEVRLDSLRLVFLSGDWIPVGMPAKFRRWNRAARLVSMGGATEASIWSILFEIERVDPAWKSIPYGMPMRNQQLYVLDAALEPRPYWVPGELYIAGVGVALGYLGDESRTRAAFITNPATGQRLYRTGDLGRYLPDGNIEFLGREDAQVKIHGYRIELGEIESALARHEAVRACAVAVSAAGDGSRRLAAYVVPRAQPAPPAAELRRFLAGRLPEYMVPTRFVHVDALPLNGNGKVDRAALLRSGSKPDRTRALIARIKDMPPDEVRELLGKYRGVTRSPLS